MYNMEDKITEIFKEFDIAISQGDDKPQESNKSQSNDNEYFKYLDNLREKEDNLSYIISRIVNIEKITDTLVGKTKMYNSFSNSPFIVSIRIPASDMMFNYSINIKDENMTNLSKNEFSEMVADFFVRNITDKLQNKLFLEIKRQFIAHLERRL